MGKQIKVHDTLTFNPEGHLQGHKVKIAFNIIWPVIAGKNAQERVQTYYTMVECGRPNCPSLWFMASIPH